MYKNDNSYSNSWLNTLLRGDEDVLWQGQPLKGKWFHLNDLYMIPFSLLWFGFVIFWEVSAIRTGNYFFILWGIPFVVIGLYMVFGRFFFKQMVKRKTRYAVTTQRIIIQKGNQLTFLTYNQIPAINRDLNRDGSGTIYFGPQPVYITLGTYSSHRCFGTRTNTQKPPTVPCLEDIPDVDLVCRILSEQMIETERTKR